MRQIKFRGKSLRTGEWLYGDLHHELEDMIAIRTLLEGTPQTVDETTVGQFTGLHDRNGDEIYEGDILIYIDNEANEHYREVVYHHGCFKFHNPYAKLPDTPIFHHIVDGKLNWVILGNIHEQSKS
jgi:uncharacterized phage protein (TIGR01671 family)